MRPHLAAVAIVSGSFATFVVGCGDDEAASTASTSASTDGSGGAGAASASSSAQTASGPSGSTSTASNSPTTDTGPGASGQGGGGDAGVGGAGGDGPDLPADCGDGACSGGETCTDCPSDCGLCALADQPGERVCIGDGSGFLDYPDAGSELGLEGGDVLCIRAGTYDGMDLGGLEAPDGSKIVVVNEGTVAFTGGVHFHDLQNVEIRGDGDDGVDFGFHVRDTGYRGLTIDGAIRRVTWSHWELTNVPDYGIRVFNPDLVWDGTDATTLYGMKFLDIRARDQGVDLFIFGNYQSFADKTSIVRDLEIARVDLQSLQSCVAINADLAFEANLHHNTLVDTGLDDTRHCGIVFLHGNGRVHHNVIDNFWGNALRSWCIGLEGADGIDFYDNIVVGSRKYSGFEAQAFDDDMAVEPAKTCHFRVVNNTFGNLTALDYVAAMVDAYYSAGSTLEVRNNLGFNIALDQPFDPEKNYAVHYVGIDGDLVTESANLYGQTPEEVGLVDDVDCRLAEESPAIDAGEAADFVTNDIDGVLRPQGAGWDVGARERP